MQSLKGINPLVYRSRCVDVWLSVCLCVCVCLCVFVCECDQTSLSQGLHLKKKTKKNLKKNALTRMFSHVWCCRTSDGRSM